MTTQDPDSILQELTASLSIGNVLKPESIESAGASLIAETVSNEAKADFLTAWQLRGESASEVAVLADFFRDRSRNPGLESFASDAIDIVGTGGDKSGTFNISTTTSIIVAAGGVPVIKHGNRSITSKTGSADLLEAIGIPLQAEDSLLVEAMEKTNYTFLFAPAFHPAFKAIVPVRKALAAEGKKTVFNILGPLINPARPHFELMGVFSKAWVSPLADVLTRVGLEAGMVASSSIEGQSIDEITSIGKNSISPVGSIKDNDVAALQTLIAEKTLGTLEDLKGGDFQTNLDIFHSILTYEANATLLNTLCINAGAAFRIVGKVDTFEDGFEMATDLLKGGKVSEWVNQTAAFYSSRS